MTDAHAPHPVRLVVEDDLRRNRLTVLVRILLAIPHLIWILLWTIVVIVAAVLGWVAALVRGRLPRGLHGFFCAYVRYQVHLGAYLSLAANPYPPFNGEAGESPVDVELPEEPQAQPRWTIAVRLMLALPALLVAAALGGLSSASYSRGGNRSFSTQGALRLVVSVLGWFASLVLGRMPKGLRDAAAYSLGYGAQSAAYLLLVTDRYPDADPTAMLDAVARPPLHPVRLEGDAHDLRRSRVTVLFRLPLAAPHLVWLLLWSVPALPASIASWLVTLVRGRPAAPLHRFLSRYVRYQLHVYAFLSLAANPFPGFAGAYGSYPLDLTLPGPERQNRWQTGFRALLAVPAWLVGSALGSGLTVAAFLTWFYALVRGRAPWGLRNLAGYALRYSAQTNAYVFLLTDVYPHASPLEGAAPAA